MNTEEIKITVPEGYEIDKENSTFECIKFKKKGLTYEDVAEKLFKGKNVCFISADSTIREFMAECRGMDHANNATSKKQLQRLLAINKLMNVAEYLNKGWKPDWNNVHENKYYIVIEHRNTEPVTVCASQGSQSTIIYFKTKELARQAIEILGEEEVKLALGV